MQPSTTRRRLLQGAGAIVLGTTTAGCNQQSATTTSPTKATATHSPTRSTSREPRATVDITREAYLVKAWTLPENTFRYPASDAVHLSSLDQPLQDAVRTAIGSGRYTTSDPSTALLDQVDDLDLVTKDSSVYDIEHTFPTVTVSLDLDVAADEAVEDRTVALEDALGEHETLADFLSTVAPYGTHNPAEPYETTRLAPSIQDFLDRYDYIDTPRGIGELAVSRTNRSPPHTIRATEATDRDLYGREVKDASRYGPLTRELIDRVLASDRKTAGNYQDRIHTIYPEDVPREFARDLVHGSHYVRVGNSVYGFDTRHVHWTELPLEFSVTRTDGDATGSGPVEVQLAVTNPSDHVVQLQMAGIAPFGILWAYGPDGEHVLWNDAFQQTEAVVVKDGAIIPESHDELELPPGQSEAATYRLGHSHIDETPTVQSGTYEALGTIWSKWPTYEGAERHDWRSQLFPFTLTIEVA